MVRSFCVSGNHEPLKCGVHGAAGLIAALCAAYNIAAWCFRRDRHLRVNAIIYTLAVLWELKQTVHHLHACAACSAPACAPAPDDAVRPAA